jgi:hypothetical protein
LARQGADNKVANHQKSAGKPEAVPTDSIVKLIREDCSWLRTHARPRFLSVDGGSGLVEEFDRVSDRSRFYTVTMFSKKNPFLLEQKYGLKNLAWSYQLPGGLSPADVELYADLQRSRFRAGLLPAETYHARLGAVVGMLLNENPALKEINFNPRSHQDVHDLVLGVTTGFTPRDINFYMSIPEPKLDSALRLPGYKELYDAANAQAKLTWVPCPDTLRDIARQIQQAPAPRFGAGPKTG